MAFIILFVCVGPVRAQYYRPPSSLQITWTASNAPPPVLWTYKVVSRPFSADIISNALSLAGLCPTNRLPNENNASGMLYFQDRPDQYCSRSLTIDQANGGILFHPRGELPNPPQDVPQEQTVARLGRQTAALLGLDRAQLIEKTKSIEYSPGQTNEIGCRGLFFTRVLDGIEFYCNGGDIRGGLLIDFGNSSQVHSFDLIWRTGERSSSIAFPAPAEIQGWIKAGKAVMTLDHEGMFDGTLFRELSAATALTVTKVTPYYEEEPPESSESPTFVAPFLQLDVIAGNNTNTVTVHLLCLIPDDMHEKRNAIR